jgi:hypothetical protein
VPLDCFAELITSVDSLRSAISRPSAENRTSETRTGVATVTVWLAL